MPQRPIVSLVTTGGTIASVRGEDGASRPVLSPRELLRAIEVDDVELRVREHGAIDSSSLSLADMERIADAAREELRDPEVGGVVVVHGTDTMEESALLAELRIDDARPVVFTGAQFTADHPDPDGPANLRAAVLAAADPASRGRGALIAFGGRLLPAAGAYKHSADRADGFRAGSPAPALPRLAWGSLGGRRVDVVALYPGADGAGIDAALAAGAEGIVLAALGSGNANPRVVEAVRRARVPVVTSSRVPTGRLVPSYGGGGGGFDLVEAGAIHSSYLRPGQARVLLTALLAAGAGREEIRRAFEGDARWEG
jgi:L-asparaginase